MDSSHSTSASTGSGAGMRTADRQAGVQATDGDEEEEFHSPMGEACSGKRKPKWLQDTLRDATSVAEPKRPVRESRPPERFVAIWRWLPASLTLSLLAMRRQLASRWLYKVKHAADGSIEKFKARFVARGFSQVEGVDYEETFASVARYTSIRSIISIAAEMGWKIHQMDVKTAFLNGFIQEEVYMSSHRALRCMGRSPMCAD
eukprot:PITA_25972